MTKKHTIVHITPEMAQNKEGISAVLEGLFTCGNYWQRVDRSLVIGLWYEPRTHRLGGAGEILYSSLDGIVNHPYAQRLAEVEQKFSVRLMYGRRVFRDPRTGTNYRPEVLLIDVSRADIHPVNALKAWMYEAFGIQSNRYEHEWEYEQCVKLAPAALAALRAIQVTDPSYPPMLVSHGCLGMPTILAALMDPLGASKTAFWAHEVPTIRRIIEQHPGHDTLFYNALDWAEKNHYYCDEMFGPQDWHFRHALTLAARHCDHVIAASELIARELRYLGPLLGQVPIGVSYHGLMAHKVTWTDKQTAKGRLQQYAYNLLEYRPDVIFSHVMRLSLAKAVWRDLRVLYHLEQTFRQDGRTGVFFLVGTDMPPRSSKDIRMMEDKWNWPVAHREGGADLSPLEATIYAFIQEFNSRCRNIKIVLVNQYGWDAANCGRRMPEDMTALDLRMGSDVTFGQGIYQPGSVSPLETLIYGGICVMGQCAGEEILQQTDDGPLPSQWIAADYTQLPQVPDSLRGMMAIDQAARDGIEESVSRQVAEQLAKKLGESPSEQFLQQGAELAEFLDWNSVCEQMFMPAIDRAFLRRRMLHIA